MSFDLGKIPPQATDLEQAVLGAVISEQDAINQVIDTLKSDSFYRNQHKEIWEAVTYLFNHNEPVDLLTVKNRLEKTGKLDDVGGVVYLVELTNKVNSSVNLEAHAKIVLEKAMKRELLNLSNEVQKEAYEDTSDVFDVLGHTEQKLSQIALNTFKKDATKFYDSYKKSIEKIEELQKNNTTISGIPTGFTKLDQTLGGLQNTDMIVIAARPGMGKEQPITRKVLTDNGWKMIGCIEAGDMVAGSDGSFYPVTGVFPQGVKDVFEVSFEDGTSTVCGLDHLWLTESRKERKQKKGASVKSLREILKSGLFTDKRKNHSVEYIKPIRYSKKELGIHPYLMGVYLGDGYCNGSTVRICNPEIDIINSIYNTLPSGNEFSLGRDGMNHSIVFKKGEIGCINSMQQQLIKFGLKGKRSYEKFIPENYLMSDVGDRLHLLRGLLDTDGYVVKGKYGTGNWIEYSTTSPNLRDGVIDLVRSLGGRVKLLKRIRSYKKNGLKKRTRENYRLFISFGEDVIPISSWKHKRFYTNKKQHHKKYINKVEFVGREECVCISVDSPDSLYVTDDYILTHNTALVMSMLRNVAVDSEYPVGVFSLEMSEEQITNRLIASESEISSDKLRIGSLEGNDWENLINKTASLASAPIFIDDTPAISILELKAKARRMVSKHHIKLIAIDYLQLMRANIEGKKQYNREQEISNISAGIKAIAKELKIPIIALSQLNRSVESRSDKTPMLSDLRESGSIEQDSDVVMFLYRPEYYGETECDDGMPSKGVAYVDVAKHRNGRTGKAKLRWIANLTKFEDLNESDHITYRQIPVDSSDNDPF